ncbi:HrpE/YscL family type III secretion apparatus protein [Candidatus Symbiopectobacterium sp. NZEC135]|uniref:HrpE/YscL family type III secretion apparatus protein n=1 Tax=Candidatus Symbiopectobacterium sp. NZEC135 TaxID=2820471 RepID=UPI0022262FFC|nr:HrpE/YscL family type III secretion apparatus protein [Candidatus Symbiopectobacterium sp. NZEC135]MCW2478778.1 hypothetical protein [Candidatus Symbiopectobacterium sp. NZEC135]
MLRKRPMAFYANRKDAGCMDGLVIHRLHAAYPVKNIRPKHTLSMALLRRSLRRQGGEGRGVLYCHSVQQNDVAAWLRQHAHLGWRLEIDARLIPGEVRLKTEGGVFTLKW